MAVMLDALLRLVRSEPRLAAEQLEAYGRLVVAQAGALSGSVRRRVALQATGTACLAVAALLAGIALMLWGTLDRAAMPVPWVLWAVPLAPAVVGGLALACAPRAPVAAAVELIREQWRLDVAAMRDLSRRVAPPVAAVATGAPVRAAQTDARVMR